MSKTAFDLCVIGGGAAGLVVAAAGTTLGAKVVLVEKNRLGGDCLYYGCVPSKSLLHSAKVAHLLRTANRFGLEAQSSPAIISKVMQRVQDVIRTIEPHDSPERFRSLGVEVIFGDGHFLDTGHFSVGEQILTAKRFILATGSKPALPPLPGLEKTPYLTNETVFDLQEPVPHLVVLGAGPIGIEMAQAFSRLGSRVTVVQRENRILPREDTDLTKVLSTNLEQEGIQLLLNHEAVGVQGKLGAVRLSIADRNGAQRQIDASHLLVATGRRANIEGLGLEAAGVETEKGYIRTSNRLQTSNKRIYACGDVNGRYPFTHMAEHQAGVVIRNALFHLPATVEKKAIPWCTFTDPELARVGLSESDAQSQGLNCRIYRFPFERVDRAQTDGEVSGLAKVIAAPNGKLLGAAILGPQAGELIHEYVLALAHKMKVSDLSRAIHIYPTLAQINRRVADESLKQRLTPTAKKWIKRLLRLRGR